MASATQKRKNCVLHVHAALPRGERKSFTREEIAQAEAELQRIDESLTREEIAAGLRLPDGTIPPEPERPATAESWTVEWCGEAVCRYLNARAETDAGRQRVSNHFALLVDRRRARLTRKVAGKEGLHLVPSGPNIRIASTAAENTQDASAWEKEFIAFAQLTMLDDAGAIDQLRMCRYQGCRVWFFTSDRSKKFHSDQCRDAYWNEVPERKSEKAAAERKRRATEKRKDLEARDHAKCDVQVGREYGAYLRTTKDRPPLSLEAFIAERKKQRSEL